MASIFMHKFDADIRVRCSDKSAEIWQAIVIVIGNDSVSLSVDERDKLIADLQATKGATWVEQEAAA